MALIDDFFAGKDIEATFQDSNMEEVVIDKIERVKNYVHMEGWQPMKEAIVFTITTSKGNVKLAQNAYNAQGEPSKNLTYPPYWDAKKEEPKAGSTMWELKEATKAKLGEKDYEEHKKAAGGLNEGFFKHLAFMARVVEGKNGAFLDFGTQNKINFWNYQIGKGDYPDYSDIPEVREMFPKVFFDNSKAVEEALKPDEDTPF